MAHFAKLDENNTVLDVIKVQNSELLDSDGNESEAVGIAFLNGLFAGTWKQTSYNGSFRGSYAVIGGSYDPDLDIFKPLKPFPSWSWNTSSGEWVAPVTKPTDTSTNYVWNEATQDWEAYSE